MDRTITHAPEPSEGDIDKALLALGRHGDDWKLIRTKYGTETANLVRAHESMPAWERARPTPASMRKAYFRMVGMKRGPGGKLKLDGQSTMEEFQS